MISSIAKLRLRLALESWLGTPYREGDQMQGIGVDCVRFVCGVLDEMYGYQRELPRNLPSDRALHDREGAIAAMHRLLTLYPADEILDKAVEPGDILVWSPSGGGPGHAMIAGPDPSILWHVEPSAGVCYTGFGSTNMELHAVYRPHGKETEWL